MPPRMSDTSHSLSTSRLRVRAKVTRHSVPGAPIMTSCSFSDHKYPEDTIKNRSQNVWGRLVRDDK